MEEKTKLDFFDKATYYYRFTDEQLEEQKQNLAFYIITELTDDNLESIQRAIADVKMLTGYDISIEEAIKMRRLVVDKKYKKFSKTR